MKCQKQNVYGEQKKVLKSPKFSQLKKSLCLFRDENCLLRLNGRLGNAECSEDFKHPIFILIFKLLSYSSFT